jgi:LysM repeat protein
MIHISALTLYFYIMKRITLFLIIGLSLFLTLPSIGQEVKKIDGKNYTEYSVQAGDGWYGIARKFGISYAELRVANKGTDDNLSVGQKILIPAKLKANDPFYEKNYIDEKKPAPVNSATQYHTVAPSQTLFSISKMHKISVDQLREWNNLKSNEISVGQKLLISKTSESAIENVTEIQTQPAPPEIKKETSEVSIPEETKVEPPEIKKEEEIKESAVEEVKTIVPTDSTTTSENKNPNKVEISNPPVDSAKIDTTNDVVIKAPDEIAPSTTEAEPEKAIIDKPLKSPVNETDNVLFSNGRKEVVENGLAVCMMDDEPSPEKYYALHRTAPIGTIIRVLNLSNSRKIYVKVTGKLTDNAENEGTLIKVSKASAEKLGEPGKSFKANLLYGMDDK